MDDNLSYNFYYSRLIEKRTHGLKKVLGGTGHGKTSAIPDVIRQDQTGSKVIYSSNRKQLLNEMAAQCKREPCVQYVHLQSDKDTIVSLLKGKHRSDFYSLLTSCLVKSLV